MAHYTAIASVGKSLERYLTSCFADPLVPPPVPGLVTRAVLARTEDFQRVTNGRITAPCLSLLLYRIDINSSIRFAMPDASNTDSVRQLPLDLHYLLTPWASDPELEHRIVGRAMHALESTPVLSGVLLTPDGGWAPNDAVEVVPDKISTESLIDIFGAMATQFKLSIPYVVRATRINVGAANYVHGGSNS